MNYTISIQGVNVPDVPAARAAYDEFVTKLTAIGGAVSASFAPDGTMSQVSPGRQPGADVQAP